MKVTVDTDQKLVEIDDSCNIVDLIEGLKGLLGKEWKEYSIVQKTNYWTYPWTYTDSGLGDYKPPYEVTCTAKN